MSSWSGEERRLNREHNNELLKRIESTLSTHIDNDNKSFGELNTKLANIDNNLGKMIVILGETQKALSNNIIEANKMLHEHHMALHGDHKDKGMLTRLEILEDQEESRKWTFRVMWSAIIALLVKTFYGFLEKR